ncbi:TerB family tellurite resistance protein [Tepidicaulis sp.]|jgi:uncharacterized tellurite resistance protein B-like protein|uniref:tellurite resistance TerB family protein n=1 Tax=Tepidicaulis sp. TaxID=1920809 RepID=UPI003B5AC677
MLDRILNFIARGPAAPAPQLESAATRRELAAAALMVEAARLDKSFDAAERAAIIRVVKERFSLSPEDATELVAVAEQAERRNYDPWVFVETVKRSFSEEEKKDLLKALWEVAYADGGLHKFESYLVNHVSKQLELTKEDCETARKAAEQAA